MKRHKQISLCACIPSFRPFFGVFQALRSHSSVMMLYASFRQDFMYDIRIDLVFSRFQLINLKLYLLYVSLNERYAFFCCCSRDMFCTPFVILYSTLDSSTLYSRISFNETIYIRQNRLSSQNIRFAYDLFMCILPAHILTVKKMLVCTNS